MSPSWCSSHASGRAPCCGCGGYAEETGLGKFIALPRVTQVERVERVKVHTQATQLVLTAWRISEDIRSGAMESSGEGGRRAAVATEGGT